MPSWKKVVASGSDASFSSVIVDTYVSASSFNGSFTGSLFGTSSQAISSSYAYTASSAISASYAATASSAQNASDILVYVKNSSGAQINKGTVVRIVGAVGDNPLIATASYTDDANSANTLGITNETIANDAFGYVMTEGTLLGIDTTAFTAGQLIYLGLNGAITGSSPVAPLHNVRLGEVLRVQLNNGSIYVRVDNGYEIGELHDVRDTTTSGSYGDLLVKSGSIWINSKQLTGSYAITGSLTVTGNITAQTLVVQTVTSSIVYSSGSNIFGNSTANTQTFTGSVNITGSLNLNGKATLTDLTGSLFGTASWAQNASTASYVLNAVSSSYAYTASSAINASASLTSISASYALTASFALNGGGGGLSALYIADEGITQGTASYLDFTGPGVIATVSNNTASITISGGGSAGQTTTLTQSVAATTWTFNHNLNTNTPIVQIYDTTYNQIIPQYVSASNATTVIVGFGIATAGYAVVSTGGTLTVTGSNVILNQPTPATTWSFVHNLNNQYPIFQVFDANNEVMIPQRIVATDYTSSLIYFPSAVSGKAVASIGGYSGSVTASFAVNASTASYALAVPFTGILSNPISASTGTAAASSTTVIASASTSSYYAAFFDYAATSGSNSRAGTVMSVWNGASVQYNEVTTNDIGSTQQVTMSVALSGGTVQLKATTTNAWTIRSLSRLI